MADPYVSGLSAARSVYDQGIAPLAEKARNFIMGATEIPASVVDYARQTSPAQAMQDVRGLGSAVVEGIVEDPARFIAELNPAVAASSAAFDSNNLLNMAAEAEARGDQAKASTLRQLATFSGATALPLLRPFRKAALKSQGMNPDDIYFHGTSSDIQTPLRATAGDLGQGISLTQALEEAENRALIQAVGASRNSGAGQNIMPVVVKENLKIFDVDRKPMKADIDELKAQGYDAVRLVEDGVVKELNVFDSNNLQFAYRDALDLPEGDPMLENLRQTLIKRRAAEERQGKLPVKEPLPEGKRVDPYAPRKDQ